MSHGQLNHGLLPLVSPKRVPKRHPQAGFLNILVSAKSLYHCAPSGEMVGRALVWELCRQPEPTAAVRVCVP